MKRQHNTANPPKHKHALMKNILIVVLIILAVSPLLFTLGMQSRSHLLDTSFIQKRLNAVRLGSVLEPPTSDNLTDDFTFLFAVVNLGRKDHLGLQGAKYTFEGDYLKHLKNIIKFLYPNKIRFYVEKQYAEHMSDILTNNVQMLHLEKEDLMAFKYYEDIELIRTSDWWKQLTPWLDYVPQGYSNLYNPLVMQKLYLLKKLSDDNPFGTRHFAWLDSGGVCTPEIKRFGVENFVSKLRYFTRSNKLLVTRSAYPMSNEIHGCQRTILAKLSGGNHPAFVTKGWMMAGTKTALDNVLPLYDELLNKTLSMGCLGTEETILSLGNYVAPHLFRSFINGRESTPFKSGDFCYFVDSRANYIEDELTFQEKWVAEQREKKRLQKEEKVQGNGN